MSDCIDGLVDTPEQALRYLDTVMCSDNEDMRRGAYNRVSIHIKQLATIAREAEARALIWQLTTRNTQKLLDEATARAIEQEEAE
jgi:hypothetical protein